MDVYFEHITEIRKTPKDILFLIVLWLLILAFCVVAFLFIGVLNPLFIILCVAAVYGGIFLTKKLNVEFEYIFTNGEIDIDMITAKSDRKRMATFNAKDIVRVEKYNKENPLSRREKIEKANVYCNKDDDELYTLLIKRRNEEFCVTLQLNETFREKMLPFMDKIIARDAFK